MIRLLTNAEPADRIEIALLVNLLEIVQQTPATTDHRQKTSTSRVIFGIASHVLGQVINPGRQNCDLDFGGTIIRFTAFEVLD